ncbi:MAG: hypothetical protein K9G33_06500 [Sneathiella sp.]|nr:hypothetical protein [Sneathiella sp.]
MLLWGQRSVEPKKTWFETFLLLRPYFFGHSCALWPGGMFRGALDDDREDIIRVEQDMPRIVACRDFAGISTAWRMSIARH